MTKFHARFEFDEVEKKKCSLCGTCGEKVALITAGSQWEVDQEAFESGQLTDDDEDVPDCVEVDFEVSAHYCLKCEKITSIYLNEL